MASLDLVSQELKLGRQPIHRLVRRCQDEIECLGEYSIDLDDIRGERCRMLNDLEILKVLRATGDYEKMYRYIQYLPRLK